MKESQLSRYGAIAKSLPFITGKTYFLVSSTEYAASTFTLRYPNDEDGVVRVYTTWASLITQIQANNESALIIISPLFTTVPTDAQKEVLNSYKCTVIQAGQNLPDGSYLATRAVSALPQTTNTNIFQVNGRVELIDLLGEIVTTIGGTATGLNFTLVPTVGSSTNISATTNGANLAIGGQVYITGVITAGTVVTTQGAFGRLTTPLILKAGNLTFNTDASNTGNIKFTLRYKPIDPGAFISPL